MAGSQKTKAISSISIVLILTVSFFAAVYASSCGCTFRRGDANNDGSVNLADAIYILDWLFSQPPGPAPCNLDRGDVNDDGIHDIADPEYLLAYLFSGGPPPPAPFPGSGCDCTRDSIETCCSRSVSLDPEALFVWDANCVPYQGAFPAWDSNVWDKGIDCSNVYITSQNNESCAHPETLTYWQVNWYIFDPHGIDSSAINNNCLRVNVELSFQVDFGIGEDCFHYPECPENLPNQLITQFPATPSLYSLIFIRSEPWDVKVVPLSAITQYSDFMQQAYWYGPDYCIIEYGPRTDAGTLVGHLSSTQGNEFSCYKLFAFRINSTALQYLFKRFGDPDLVKSEAITPSGASGFSVRLHKIEYDWCNP